MPKFCWPLVAVLACVSAAGADPLPLQSPRVVDYVIAVRLDPGKKTLTGRERLTWRNPSADSVGELWFHLYLNAFRNNRSTFFRESGGQLRGIDASQGGWGWIHVDRLQLAGGPDLTGAMRFMQPDDGNPDDRTVMKVTLPAPVPPRGSVTLEIDFTAQLPKVFARTGYHHDYFFAGQWFPKLGVYEPAGTRGRSTGGWNCHQFHGNSEFYADFGTYQVDVTVPDRFHVGATGERTGTRRHDDGTTTYTYRQAGVHDFAWTAYPGFVEVNETFSAERDVTRDEYERAARTLGRAIEDVHLRDVQIRLLLQPARRAQAGRYLAAAKQSLKHFGLWYGRYPYRTLTMVDPAFGAGGSGGMEYPTLVTLGTSMLLNRGPLRGVLVPEHVTVHEIAHQYWHGLVASNEFEEAWLDEGIASYSSGRLLDLEYGPRRSVATLPGLTVGVEAMLRAENGPWQIFNRIRQPAWAYSSAGAYAFYSYTKPELVLRTLEHHLGPVTMARVMRTYHERWRFRHPSSDDFYAVAQEVSGRDLRWFFDQLIEGTGVLDYEIASLHSAERAAVAGVVDGKNRPVAAPAAAAGNRKSFEHDVLVRRLGEVVFPTVLQLRFADGSTRRVPWDGRERWKRFVLDGPERLVEARLDPDLHLTVETTRLNSARRVEPDPRVAAKWSARWLFWIQNLIAAVGF